MELAEKEKKIFGCLIGSQMWAYHYAHYAQNRGGKGGLKSNLNFIYHVSCVHTRGKVSSFWFAKKPHVNEWQPCLR